MPLLTRPELVVAGILEADTNLALGVDLFSGPPKPWKGSAIPRSAVFVYSMLSFRPVQYLGSARHALRDIRIMTYIRQQQDQFALGQALGREIWDALNQADVTAYTGYVACQIAEADAQYLGLDDVDDHRWVLNVRLLHKG
jgi:hypothetical protein